MATSRSLRLRETWVICFILGVIMLNYPFIEIFNKATLVFGIPLLVIYFFIGWPISILVILAFCSGIRHNESADPEEQDLP